MCSSLTLSSTSPAAENLLYDGLMVLIQVRGLCLTRQFGMKARAKTPTTRSLSNPQPSRPPKLFLQRLEACQTRNPPDLLNSAVNIRLPRLLPSSNLAHVTERKIQNHP